MEQIDFDGQALPHHVFTILAPEREHQRTACIVYREPLEIFSRLHSLANEGFPLLGELPSLDDRQEKAVSVCLFSRSFKSLHCAIDCALRGYYGAAITLVRSVYENVLTYWEFITNPASVDAIYEDYEAWWRDDRRFGKIARDLDAKLVASGQTPFVVDMWQDMYGTLSRFAHPRAQGLAIEYHSTKDSLLVAPDWDDQRFHMALILIIMASRLNLVQMTRFVNVPDSDWHREAGAATRAASEWVAAQG